MIAALLLSASILVSCSQPSRYGNKAAGAPEKKGGTPPEAKPMGALAPGYYAAGPNGAARLKFDEPKDGSIIEGDSVRPVLTITGYPIYKDQTRNKGQHIHVILDNEPYEDCYDVGAPFSSDRLKGLKEGTHTLRAFPVREWHESVKQSDGAAFDLIVFHVKRPTAGIKIDKGAPLLTYSTPKGEHRWKEDPRGLMLDFYVTNATLGPNAYRVKYTINDRKSDIINRWEPVWFKWEEFQPGDYKIVLELLDKDNKPVPFMVGRQNYNRIERRFRILAEGER